jgi:curved DNA-binding protein CbpA
MGGEPFVDYYELLQVSANANEDTIHRIFRHLAKKYHPDAPDHGNAEQFSVLVEAHRLLTNVETRAAYDVKYQQFWDRSWKLASEAADPQGFVDDVGIRERLMSLFYVQRRRSMRNPGMGEMDLARLVGTPPEHVEFHLWYLREKGWIQRLETGMFAITAEGVDQVERHRIRVTPERLIETRVPQGDAGSSQAAASSRKTAS